MAGGLLLLFETAAGYALFTVKDGANVQAADAQVGRAWCVGRAVAAACAQPRQQAMLDMFNSMVPIVCRTCITTLRI